MKRKISEFVSASGVAFEVIRAIANAVLDAGGSDADLAALRSNPTKLAAIAALVVDRPAAAPSAPTPRPEPPLDAYTVFVDYVLPPQVELKKLFDRVCDLWDGGKWTLHDSLKGVPQAPGELVFCLKNFGKEMSSEAVIAWAEANGYRVATHLEALAFARANPEIQRERWYFALGSFALRGPGRRVACLDSSGPRRELESGWFGGDWRAHAHFLLVRK